MIRRTSIFQQSRETLYRQKVNFNSIKVLTQLWYSQEPNNPFASASTRLMMIMHCNSVTNWWTFVWMLNFHWKSIVKKALDCLHFLLTSLVPMMIFKKNLFKRPCASFSKVRNGILLPKLVWPTVRKKLFKWLREFFEIRG